MENFFKLWLTRNVFDLLPGLIDVSVLQSNLFIIERYAVDLKTKKKLRIKMALSLRIIFKKKRYLSGFWLCVYLFNKLRRQKLFLDEYCWIFSSHLNEK